MLIAIEQKIVFVSFLLFHSLTFSLWWPDLTEIDCSAFCQLHIQTKMCRDNSFPLLMRCDRNVVHAVSLKIICNIVTRKIIIYYVRSSSCDDDAKKKIENGHLVALIRTRKRRKKKRKRRRSIDKTKKLEKKIIKISWQSQWSEWFKYIHSGCITDFSLHYMQMSDVHKSVVGQRRLAVIRLLLLYAIFPALALHARIQRQYGTFHKHQNVVSEVQTPQITFDMSEHVISCDGANVTVVK